MDATLLLKNAPLILAISIVGVLGFLILLAVGMNMWRNESKPKESASGDPAGEAAAPKRGFQMPSFLSGLSMRRPDPATKVELSSGASTGAHEVLRVLRDHLTGRIVVEIAGKRYTQLNEITDAAMRPGLLVTLRDLQEFAGLSALPTPGPASPASAPLNVSAAPPQQATATAPPAPFGAPGELVALNPLTPRQPAQPSSPPPMRIPSMNPFKQMMVLREINANEPPPPRPIADQIDDVLQALTAGTPFAERGLHVRSGPRGNVIFEADGESYNSVDDMPDASVQTVFREAVRQWEQQS